MKDRGQVKWVMSQNKARAEKTNISHYGDEKAKEVRTFHKSFPLYKETPLVDLKNLSRRFGLSKIYIKDESKRFDLNAFKVLGGSYATAAYFSDKYSIDMDKLDYDYLKSEEMKKKVGDMLFVTATDGNHGRGIAWTARELGYRAVVFMPKVSSMHRVNNIRSQGAEVNVLDCNYDNTVNYAREYAIKNNGVLMQDTALDGYEDIPSWIMQGYLTIGQEIREQLEGKGEKISHVFLQAGVGSYTAVLLAYFVNLYGGDNIKSIIVEPDSADCIYQSALANDGEAHGVDGDLDTIMAGLACGIPNPLAWPILRDYSDCFVSCPDYVAARGVRILSNPLDGDERVISGESAAPGLGLLSLIMEEPGLKGLKDDLGLDENSKVLVISTEGDTDPDSYRRILWD